MAKERPLSGGDIKAKSTDYSGTAHYVKISLGENPHIYMTFDQAIKFSLCVQHCVLQLNGLDRKLKNGRDMGMVLRILPDKNQIKVIQRIATKQKKARGVGRMNYAGVSAAFRIQWLSPCMSATCHHVKAPITGSDSRSIRDGTVRMPA